MRTAINDVIYRYWPTVIIVLSIVIILRVTSLIKSGRKSFVLYEEIYNLFFIAYLLILFNLVTNQDMATVGGTNFVPFKEIMRYDFGSSGFYKQVIGNILLFIPLGYFATGYCKLKKIGGILIVSLLSSTTIEVVQHFIGRSFDVDDIILNVVGGIIGFLIYIGINAIKNRLPRFMRKKWFYNLLCLLVIVAIIFYLFKVL